MSVHTTQKGWTVRWRQGHKNASRSFPKADGFTKDDALRFDLSMKRRRKMGGIDPLASERDFVDVVNEWWPAQARSLSPAARKQQDRYLENDILCYFEGYRLCDISPPQVMAFLNELADAGRGPSTQRKIILVLSAALSYAQEMGYLISNPVAPIRKRLPKVERERLVHPFPPERVEEVRNWFLDRDDLEGATFVSVLAYAGPRPAEAYSYLTARDIGSEHIIFRGEKTGRDRQTRLLEPLRADLRAFQGFLGTGHQRTQTDIRRLPTAPLFNWTNRDYNQWRDWTWKKMTDELGLELEGKRARPYDLRHSFANLLIAEGYKLHEVAKQMGNSLKVCEQYYTHLEHTGEAQDAEERIWEARRGLSERDRAGNSRPRVQGLADASVSQEAVDPLAESDREAM